MRHFFVINAHSFYRESALAAVIQGISACFDSSKENYDVYISRYTRDAIIAVHKYASGAQGETARVYAVGGDGIFFDCLNGAVGLDNVQLTSVPYGNCNDVIRIFGENKYEYFRDLPRLINAPARRMDIMRVGRNYGVISCSVGVEASAYTDLSRLMSGARRPQFYARMLNPLCRLSAARIMLFDNFRSQRYTIEIDGEDYSGEYMNLIIANSGKNAKKNIPIPEASTLDGFLDAVIVKPMPRLKSLSVMTDYSNGRWSAHPDLCTHVRFRKIHVESDRPLTVVLDGELYGTVSLDAEVLPGAINIVVPDGIDFDRGGVAAK